MLYTYFVYDDDDDDVEYKILKKKEVKCFLNGYRI